MKKRFIRKIPIVIAVATLGIIAFSGLVMLLWNSILPSVLHIGAITFWQAAGILLLAKILFGGFRGHGGRWRHKRMAMRWHNMTPEEREKMHGMSCCGRGYAPAGAGQ